MSTNQMTFPQLVSARITRGSVVINVTLILAASLIIAASAQVAIPLLFSPVPMTLQPLAVLLVGAALGAKRGAAATALYLFEGLAGLPVFAGGLAGPLVLFGPTGGYLLAFPLAAAIAGFASERGLTRSPIATAPLMALALATIHAGGWAWLTAGLHFAPAQAFALGVVPFLAADLVKVAIATALLPAASAIVARFSRLS
jgi:biotin transport system substrate-specific component